MQRADLSETHHIPGRQKIHQDLLHLSWYNLDHFCRKKIHSSNKWFFYIQHRDQNKFPAFFLWVWLKSDLVYFNKTTPVVLLKPVMNRCLKSSNVQLNNGIRNDKHIQPMLTTMSAVLINQALLIQFLFRVTIYATIFMKIKLYIIN